MSPAMLRLVLAAALLPFFVLAIRDEVLHWTVRRPSIAERLVHLGLAGVLTFAVARAFVFDRDGVLAAVVAFVGLGAVDEFVFHRGLPASEADTHAKEHLALLAWLVTFEALAPLMLRPGGTP